MSALNRSLLNREASYKHSESLGVNVFVCILPITVMSKITPTFTEGIFRPLEVG